MDLSFLRINHFIMKMQNNPIKLFLVVSFFMINFIHFGTKNCSGVNGSMSDVDRHVSALSDKVILFGHQSVGQNIVDGLSSIKNLNNDVFVRKIEAGNPLNKGGINHMYLGNNEDPVGKIEGFVKLINQYSGNTPDIALFKFCYLDINERTDIDRLFSLYEKTIEDLEKKFPEMAIVHTTVPLRQVQTGPKAWIKRIIGKPVTGLSDNVAREKFNTAMRRAYGQRLLYDIALHESTYPDGGRESFQRDGATYYVLVPLYTDDGDHLNKEGGEMLARQLVRVLVEAAKKHGAR